MSSITINSLIYTLLFSSQIFASNLSEKQKLGKKLFFDINLSIQRNQSCESCHSLSPVKVPTELRSGQFIMQDQPAPGFVDPGNIQSGSAVSSGSRLRTFGSLNAPSISYASFSPEFYWNGELFIGGQFWNGRATDLVAQAKEPFLNPGEMAMLSEWSVIQLLQENKLYKRLFRKVSGIRLNRVTETNTVAISKTFNAVAEAIAAFKRTPFFNRFNSKFDYEAAGITQYNASEQRGTDLFDGEAQCDLCHTSEGIAGDNTPALLTDFSYDNLGVPANPLIPGNPKADVGLLGNPNLSAVRGEDTPSDDVEGRHKVMSLRNVQLTPPYMHNVVFSTLGEVVHFYNTRDVLPACKQPSDITNSGFGKTCWPEGEFHATRNTEELGNLGLSDQDEADLVAYLKTFTDNYPDWGNKLGLHDLRVPNGSPSPFVHFMPKK